MTLDPGPESQAFAEAELECVDVEPATLDEETQDAVAQQRELADVMGILADRYDLGGADDLA